MHSLGLLLIAGITLIECRMPDNFAANSSLSLSDNHEFLFFNKSWIQASLQVGTESIEVWESSDAYNAWMDGVEISDATGEFEGNYKGIVYNTIDDRGDIATERSAVEDFIVDGDAQWVIDHVEERGVAKRAIARKTREIRLRSISLVYAIIWGKIAVSWYSCQPA